MELPFTVVFEPPSQAELRAVLRLRRTWLAGGLSVLAIGTLCAVVFGVGRSDAAASSPPLPVHVTSRPSGAGVWLDGRNRGSTPLEMDVVPGAHEVLLKASDAMDGRYLLHVGPDAAGLDAVLWRRQPILTRLRPTLPGGVITSVGLLAGGEIALSLALPPGAEMQAWRLDPMTGAVAPVVTDAFGARLTVAADGQHAAFVGYEVGPPALRSGSVGGTNRPTSVLWLAGDETSSAPRTGWRPPLAEGERLLDASWSPQADRLMAVSGQSLAGGAVRSRVWFVDSAGQRGQAVLSLPSQVVPGSEAWSPDGQHVAFVAHAGEVNALCLVDLDGTFRYIADLEPRAEPPHGFLPAAWATDSQRLVFVAPHQHPPGAAVGWLQPDRQRAVYVASATDGTPVFVGDTDTDLAAWREDGQVLGLGRLGSDGALAVRLLAETGAAQRLVDLPLRPAPGYAATWDVARGRLLLANPNTTGVTDFWLAQLGF